MQFVAAPRQSVVAGRFYPADPKALSQQVSQFLAARPRKLTDLKGGEALAVLVPHAGYVFSGAVAGMTLGQIPVPDRVIALGPNHTGLGAPLSVWNGGPWRTPLGDMPVDTETASALVAANAGFEPDRRAHLQEHSLEVLVPFFQVANPKSSITPITVSSLPVSSLRAAGEALARIVAGSAAQGRGILLVVSSDMSHYLPHERAVTMDTMALEALKTLNPQHYFSVVRENNISMCGVFPMTLVLFALRELGVSSVRVLAYATSGQTGAAYGAGMDKVVGYAGAVMMR